MRALSDRPTAVILYDLIPYEFADHYLADPRTRSWYDSKLGHLRRADLVLTISEATRERAIDLAALDASRTLNISAAVEDEFQHAPGTETDWDRLRRLRGIRGEFILYTGGHDFRKNIDRLIEAFSGLPPSLLTELQLVIVCAIDSAAKEDYLALADQFGVQRSSIIFTGYVPNAELLVLYSRCKLFVFPSVAEGFGLPVLEAMKCGAVVIGSNRSSIPEVVGIEEALFDPFDPISIRVKMIEGLTSGVFRNRLATHFARQSLNFSWDSTAKKVLSALADFGSSSARTHNARKSALGASDAPRPHSRGTTTRPDQKLRLAHVSPLPPIRSGIATYVADLLPDLADYYRLELISDGQDVPDWWGKLDVPVRSPRWLAQHAGDFDRVVYHFGNSEFHDYMPELLSRVPGAVILHDFFLSGLQNFRETVRGHAHALRDSLIQSHGYGGAIDLGGMRTERIEGLPASYGVLANAKGTIVHSRSAVELAGIFYGEDVAADLLVAPLAQARPSLPSRNAARAQLGIGVDEFLVCSFGFVHDRKLSALIAAAWADFRKRKAGSASLCFVGSADEPNSRRVMFEGPGDGSMRIAGWVDDAVYNLYLSAADVAVQLRADNRGESSKAVLECLSCGIPTIVNAIGTFSELPSDCVFKLMKDVTAPDVSRAIEVLWTNPELRAKYRNAAMRQLHAHHAPALVAKQYHDHIEEIYRRPASLLSSAWSRAVDMNWPVRADTLREAATTIGRQVTGGCNRRQHLVLVDPSSAGVDIPREALRVQQIPVQPVYLDSTGTLRHARRLTAEALGLDPTGLHDDLVELERGDVIETQTGADAITITFLIPDSRTLRDMLLGLVSDA